MAVEPHEIEDRIIAHLPDAVIKIDDLRGDGDHYAAHVTSSAFEGVSRIERQRMVQRALKDILTTKLHALSIKTDTP